MLRIAGVTLNDDQNLYDGLRMIKGLDSKHSRTKVERILTKARLYKKVKNSDGKIIKVYPKVGELSEKEKQRLIDLVDIPRAIVRNVRISPKKLRLVADQIRGKHVDEALSILEYTPKAGAPILYKLLKSAIANADNNHGIKADNLYVAKVMVNPGPTMYRYTARARGRATPIRKRTSHAIIVLREKIKSEKKSKSSAINQSSSSSTMTKSQNTVELTAK